METQRNYISSLEEIQNRRDPLYGDKAKIYEIYDSVTRDDLKVVIFADGSQANIDIETFNKLNNK